MALIDHARKALSLGLHVFPLRPRTKHPATAHGFKDSSADPEQIERWWQAVPDYNIGINAGASGIAVLDVDHGLNSREDFEAWLTVTGIPRTYAVHTGRRTSYGVQMYYKGTMPSSGAGKWSLGGCTGEIKSLGGYVVCAGSVHPDSGESYEVILDDSFTDLPALVRDSVSTKKSEQPEAAAQRADGEKIPPGSWHDLLVSFAGTLFNAGITSAENLYRAMLVYARENFDTTTVPLDKSKVEQIAKSAAELFEASPSTGVSPDWEPIAPQEQNPDTSTAEFSAQLARKEPKLFNFTDAGNMERLVYWYGDGFKYCPQHGWYVWNSKQWVADSEGRVTRAALRTVRAIPQKETGLVLEQLPGFATNEERGKAQDEAIAEVRKFANASESRRALEAMVALSRSAAGIATDISKFDSDNWLFNCQNTTLGLYKREEHPHAQADLITSISPVAYDPEAKCPLWEQFLQKIMGGSEENISFLQRAAGYSMTGSAAEQCMFVLWGNGSNGKSTFIEVIRYILGEYGKPASMGMFLDQTFDKIPNDLAALAGIRYVSATETREGRRLDEEKIKQICGGDTVAARFLHKEWFEFRPEFKIWLATNHRPTIRGTDDGIWRRIRLVPFTVQIPKEEQDKHLRGKLIAEASGILNWMIAGLEDYRAGGLRETRDITEATQDYRDTENWVVRFLASETEEGPYVVQARALFTRYKEWAVAAKEYVLSEKKFNVAMDEHGLEAKRPDNKKVFVGRRIRFDMPGSVFSDQRHDVGVLD